MASSATTPYFSSFLPTPRTHGQKVHTKKHSKNNIIVICATRPSASNNTSGEPGKKRDPPAGDTRIHWDNQDDGWLGGNSRKQESVNDKKKKKTDNFGERFADLINTSATSHYQFLGVPASADMEEIKTAYRKLSKEYHPDTTSLPLKTASTKFIQLREAYIVLSKEESRRFYDWTLAQEAESRQARRMVSNIVDPFEQDRSNFESVPDIVDRLGGIHKSPNIICQSRRTRKSRTPQIYPQVGK